MTPSDLSFATKFVAVYLFIKVKGYRPMTYQYLTVDMVESAKTMVASSTRKNSRPQPSMDSIRMYLTDTNMQVLDGYISAVRPLLKPALRIRSSIKRNDVRSRLITNTSISEDRSDDEKESCTSTEKEQCRDNVNDESRLSACEELVQSSSKSSGKQQKRKQMLLFTPREDEHLSDGIKRHGFGHWSAILKDPRYTFQKGRTANSLLNRASRKFNEL